MLKDMVLLKRILPYDIIDVKSALKRGNIMRLIINDLVFEKLNAINSMNKGILFIKKRRNKALKILNEPEISNNPAVIKYLLELVLDKDSVIAYRAVECIRKSLANLNITDWLVLCEDIKSYSYRYPRKLWFAMNEADLNIFNNFEKDKLMLLGLASCHSNGYIREAALKELDNFNTGDELKYFLLRANDWVGKIRDLSERCILKRIHENNTRNLIEHLPLIYHLKNCSRKEHSGLISKVDEIVIKSDNKELLLSYVNSDDKNIRRICYKILLDLDTAEELSIISKGLNSRDNVIQNMAVSRIFSLINEENAEVFYEVLKKNRKSNIRKHIPDIIKYCKKIDQIKEWKSFLVDTNSTARESARFWLSKEGFSDFREIYINSLQRRENIHGSICGLGEVGREEDADLLIEFIDESHIKITKAVFKALYKLDAAKYVNIFLKYLSSNKRGISKEARKGLEECIYLVDEKALWEILNLDIIPEYVYNNILILFKSMSKWKSLIQILKLFSLKRENIIEQANEELRLWLQGVNRSYISPTKSEIETIKSLFIRHKNKIYNDFQGVIESILRE